MRILTIRLLLPAAMAFVAGAGLMTMRAADQAQAGPPFRTSHTCLSCHNGLTTAAGDDVSIGSGWRAGMMANAARDPYWQAGVRRELLDHPEAAAEIEAECSICHMPMATVWQRATGGHPQVFAHLASWPGTTELAQLAQDGASCTVCHQIGPDRLGTRESFTGGFVVRTGDRGALGPYDVAPGLAHVMQSASTFQPTAAPHLRESEICATCHTLFTHALGAGVSGQELPEQVPYLEWRHSAYRGEQSCQSCHMPVAATQTPIASVLGAPREHFSEHGFRGGNFVVARLLTLHRAELGTEAQPQELEAGVARTLEHLKARSATIAIDRLELQGRTLVADVRVANLAGHKLPTAYPSRRAWLHLVVIDASGTVRFESGRVEPSGRIEGNDNDADARAFEPHHGEIRSAGDVQIYETVMGDAAGQVTTGLLTAVRFLKDNRVLPRGFEKATAPADIAVHGAAAEDGDFTAGSDVVRYAVPIASAPGPLTVTAELLYQPIAWRWAQNLKEYGAPEPQRFTRYFDGLRGATATVLARTTASTNRTDGAAASVQAPAAGQAITPARMMPLFNGRDLSNWEADVPEKDTNTSAPDSFIVRNGMLVSLGTPPGHLLTRQAYRDYRLEVEYRFPGKPGNCGVLVHASRPRALYRMFPQSIEVQMNSGDAGDFWCIQENIEVPDMETRRPRKPGEKWGGAEGDARRILNLTDGSEKPLGQWNTMIIEARGRSVTVWVNGDLVNNGVNATADQGRIAIQAEGAEVEFRRVQIGPLSAAK